MADWAELPHDMLELIVKKINLLEDFVRFGAVCRSWKIAATSNKKNLRPQIPWLVLPDKPGNDHPQIYSLSKEEILTKNLYVPEMSDKDILLKNLYVTEKLDKKCIGLHHGWVLTEWILTGRQLRGKINLVRKINLVHPISHSQIELPQSYSYKYKDIKHPSFLIRAALSGNPSESSDFILMIAHMRGPVYYWRPGAKHWIGIDGPAVIDVTYYQDRFYSISYNNDGWALWGYKLVDHDHSIVAYQINITMEEFPLEKYKRLCIVGSLT